MTTALNMKHLRRMAAVALLLFGLCACSSNDANDDVMLPPTAAPADGGYEPKIATDNQYINLSIVVSTGQEGTTRAPLGGEDGDGREVGFERENRVTGITLMLYEGADGINTATATARETTLAFVGYYPVTLIARPGEQKDIEVTYSTGDHAMGDTGLDLNKTYHAIVVANQDLRSTFTAGSSTLQDVRDGLMTKVCDGTGFRADATNFVMSSERDCTINFKEPDNKSTTANGKTYYYFNKDIVIERLAARVDFWTENSTGYDAARDGYTYSVTGSTDEFVLTAVTPFNLYENNDAATEYLLKRLGKADGSDISYLAVEPADYQNQPLYVLDPKTREKVASQSPSTPQDPFTPSIPSPWEIKTYRNTPAIYQHTEASTTADNIIICYPKENTLLTESPLCDYATGLCIEGDYYKNGTKYAHYTYYGYLRHQGEGDGAYTITAALDPAERSKFPMNFGVVRNNIDRVSIGEIRPKGTEPPQVTWQIKVKKWDTFKHETIYM